MLAYALMILGILVRFIPHMPNSAPVGTIALFAGAYLDRKLVPWIPLAIMMISDFVIGLHGVVLFTWGALVLTSFLGMYLREKRTPLRVGVLAVFSSVLFFVITNFGVWLAWYPRTAVGFVDCYIKAIPFLRNDLASNLIGALVLFGSYELLKKAVTEPRLRAVLIAE